MVLKVRYVLLVWKLLREVTVDEVRHFELELAMHILGIINPNAPREILRGHGENQLLKEQLLKELENQIQDEKYIYNELLKAFKQKLTNLNKIEDDKTFTERNTTEEEEEQDLVEQAENVYESGRRI